MTNAPAPTTRGGDDFAAARAERTRATLGAYLDAVSARADFGRYLHEDATLVIAGGPIARGRAEVEALIRTFHGQTFDARLRVGRLVCEPGPGGTAHAAAELVFAGTHTGEFAGVPASGRTVEVPHGAAYDIGADGRITAVRVYLPMQLLTAQIGGAS